MKFFILAASLLWALCAQAQAPTNFPLNLSKPNTTADNTHTDHWRIIFSPYSVHYTHSPEHKHVWMLGAEKKLTNSYLWGGTYFSNSFGQDSAYVYGGRRYENFSRHAPFFAQWTAGLMYGYKGRFANKVPFNYRGFSPGLVLSFGWKFNSTYSAQLNVLGNSALMLQTSIDLN